MKLHRGCIQYHALTWASDGPSLPSANLKFPSSAARLCGGFSRQGVCVCEPMGFSNTEEIDFILQKARMTFLTLMRVFQDMVGKDLERVKQSLVCKWLQNHFL